jgi:Holliday junction DNA helicase RuvA
MIAKLRGLVDSVGQDNAVLDVSGVGYLVFASKRTLSALPPPGDVAALLIDTHVREDHIHLYGFLEAAERDWFGLLCTVQGVGARVALAILSVLPPERLVQAIAAQDKTPLTQAGPKVAGRIVSELKDKAGSIALGAMAGALGDGADGTVVVPSGGVSEDAVSALVNLGYRRVEAFGAVARAAGQLGGDASVESLIRVGLKELAS